MLFLVDLTLLDEVVDLAESVESESDRLQQCRVVPLDELRADHSGVRSVQLLDEYANGIGRRRDVVVTDEEQPIVALDEVQHLVDRDPEARVGTDCAHEGAGESIVHPPLGRFRRGPRVEEEEAEVRIVLRRERVECVVEP